MTNSNTVLPFLRSKKLTDNDWTQQQLAEFYRVEAALLRGGLLVDVERGLTDEGDPWFVFCRRDNGEVIAHFARIGDQYVVASSAFSGVVRGRDFGLLLTELMRAYSMALPISARHTQNVFLHPAAMLAALLATAFVISSNSDVHDQHAPDSLGKEAIRLLSLSDFTVLSAIAIATTWIENQIESALQFLENNHDPFVKDTPAASDTHVTSDLVLSFEPHKIGDESARSITVNGDSHADSSIADQSTANHPSLIDKGQDPSASLPTTASEASGHVPVPSTSVSPADVLPSLPAAPAYGWPIHASTSANDQLSATVTSSDASQTLASSDASQTLASSLGGSGNNMPIVTTTANFTLSDSIQYAVYHHVEHAIGQLGSAAPITSPLPHPQLASPLPLFDAEGNAILQAFIKATPSIEEDFVGRHVIIIDQNSADLASSHAGSQSWAFTDGSTLTIVGIIPTSSHMNLHTTGA